MRECLFDNLAMSNRAALSHAQVQSQDPALENLVGCFATPIPVHIRAHPGTTTFRQLLQHAYAELLDAIDHADIPLFRVAQAVVKARSATHNPLFQTIVQLLPTAILPLLRQTMADDPNDLIPSEADQLMGIDLFMNLMDSGDRAFNGTLTFNASLLKNSTAEALSRDYASLVSRVTHNPDMTLDEACSHCGLHPRRGDAKEAVTEAAVEPTPQDLYYTGRRVPVLRRQGAVTSTFEVESALRRHPSVRDAIVHNLPRDADDTIAVAVKLHPGCSVTLNELNAAVTSMLRTCWLPEVLVSVDQVPIDHGGKLMRDHLAASVAPARRPQAVDDPTVSDLPWVTPGSELLSVVLDQVRTLTQNADLSAATPLMDAGLNSLSATKLALVLEQQTGVVLSPTLIFQYPTANAIATHLQAKLEPTRHEQLVPERTPSIQRVKQGGGADIVGTASRWPSGASSDRELARLAGTTFDAVSEVPASRWTVSDENARNPAVLHMAHVPNADLFDHAAFAISVAEATWMDPQQRLLLEKGYAAVHNADLGRSLLLGYNLAVVLGIQANDFGAIVLATPASKLPLYAVSGFAPSVAAGRLSYVLGLQVTGRIVRSFAKV